MLSRLTIVKSSFEDIATGKVNIPNNVELINASYCLPFCDSKNFQPLMSNLFDTLRPDGIFAGQLLGKNDEWTQVLRFDENEVSKIFEDAGFKDFNMDHIEKVIPTHDGNNKYWDIYDIVSGMQKDQVLVNNGNQSKQFQNIQSNQETEIINNKTTEVKPQVETLQSESINSQSLENNPAETEIQSFQPDLEQKNLLNQDSKLVNNPEANIVATKDETSPDLKEYDKSYDLANMSPDALRDISTFDNIEHGTQSFNDDMIKISEANNIQDSNMSS